MKIICQFLGFLLLIAGPIKLNAQPGNAYEMNIQGVKVIVQPGGNDIIVVQTIIKGGVENYPAAKAGIESLALTALTECGTTSDDKNSFKDKLDKVSARVSGNTGMDYATFRMNCIKSDLETVWPLYTQAMLNPRFDTKEFDRIKSDAINTLRAMESNPDNAIDKMARQTAFAGKSYAKEPRGTAETIGKLTALDTKNYWKSILTRSRMIIVVVGDMGRDDLEAKISGFISAIPAGQPVTFRKISHMAPAHSFKAEKRDNATNYIQGITGGPLPGTPDFNSFALAMRIFNTRHFVEIRSKNGLSYAPGSWFNAGNANYANIFVTTTEPDKYIAVARQLIDKVKKEGFTEQELKNIKTQYLTEMYYRQETNDALASSLAANEIIHGNWRRTFTIKDDIAKITLNQLNNAFRKYINNITWSYQGDPKKVTPSMFTQKQTPAIPKDKKAF